jgi:hypothetical protein
LPRGKDTHQNEIIYRKHFHRGDVYVHAELPGAASMFIKNKPNKPEAPIPPSTLSQAGTLSIATSTAWDNKAVMSAWWVKADQVSKIASTGDHLAAGTFSISGTKNFMPPNQLVLGFGVLFQIDEGSKSRHSKHRVLDTEGESRSKVTRTPDEDQSILEKMTQATENLDLDSDEEGFPDARLDSGSESEDEDRGGSGYKANQGNPLQNQANPIQSSEPSRNLEVATVSTEMTEAPAQNHERVSSIDGTREENLETATKSEDKNEVEVEDSSILGTTSAKADEKDNDTDPKESNGSQEPPGTPSSRAGPPKRGKRAKQKKLARKYADQDDEDRELAMKLLGSAAAKAKAEEEAEARLTKEKELGFQKERRKEQHQRAAKQARDYEEARRLAGPKRGEGAGVGAGAGAGAGSEGEEQEQEESFSTAIDLDCFIGAPLPGDHLISAIPVCAPWTAMANYKYRVKMQPGTQKKSRAIKDILGAWILSGDKKRVDEKSEDVEKIWPQETELIKNWKDTELINTVPVSKVRVMLSAGASWRGAPAKGTAKGRKPAKKS